MGFLKDKMLHFSLAACLGALCISACGSEGNGPFSSGGGEGTTTAASTGQGASGGAASSQTSGNGGSFLPGCASGILCGSGECCTASEECIAGSCLAVCSSQVRCGPTLETCCASSEVCLAEMCVEPGQPCSDWADCDAGEFCEPTLKKCLPQPQSVACELTPQFGPLEPTVEWSWTSTTTFPTFVQVINMPVVADLENDGTPDVLVVTSDNYSANGSAYLRALDGKTGLEKWAATTDVYKPAFQVQPRGTPAAADIDGDGLVEIVTLKKGGGLIAFEHDGSHKWSSTQADGLQPYNPSLASATVAIADLEGNGTPEIVVAGLVFESDGRLRFDQGPLAGSNNGGYGAVSIVADLDQQGAQEIVTGRRAWRSDGTLFWDNGLVDGYPAIADFDGDQKPEVVVIAGGTVRVQDPLTGQVLAQMAMPAQGAGGPPTIANFDSDPAPEIASANGGAYAVFGYSSNPAPTLTLQWSQPTQDLSSNRTGSSVFDFQGDGIAEVVYADECYFRGYNGPDGKELFKIESASATIHEYPVVVDVDGDNNSEIVVVANNLNHVNASVCPYPGSQAKAGVFVYGDKNDNWVRTRRIWNQHAYHITNITGAAAVPAPEPASWLKPKGYNNYRQSIQGAGVFNAPDLQVSLAASLAGCPSQVDLLATVQNKGSLGVPAGVPVSFYTGDNAQGAFIATTTTTQALLPGQSVTVSTPYALAMGNPGELTFFVVVDANQMGQGAHKECLEDNNDATVSQISCPPLR